MRRFIRLNPICIECGKKISLEKAIPIKWNKGKAFVCRICYYAGVPALAPRTYNPKKRPRTPRTSAEALIKKEHEEQVSHWMEKLLMQRYVTDREGILYELVKKAQKDEDLIPVVRSVVTRLKLLPELEQVQRRLGKERTARNPLYESFHRANPTLRRVKIRTPRKGEKLVKLGRLIALEYEPEYPSKLRGTVYRHQMGDTGRMVLKNKPLLATGARGKGLYIIDDGAKPHVTGRGIVG